VGSFCQFSVLVNGGKRWSMAVNENRWETIAAERRQRHLPPQTVARATTLVEWLFSFILPFTVREIVNRSGLHGHCEARPAPRANIPFRPEPVRQIPPIVIFPTISAYQ
jgi:hypothetical protein